MSTVVDDDLRYELDGPTYLHTSVRCEERELGLTYRAQSPEHIRSSWYVHNRELRIESECLTKKC